jgi:predicted secreted protein
MAGRPEGGAYLKHATARRAMTWFSAFAVFFIIWWTVLFAMLPFGLKTQDEDNDVTLGTVPSAPRGPHMLKVVIRTTIVSLAICAIFYGLTHGLGYGFDDLPKIVPEFD